VVKAVRHSDRSPLSQRLGQQTGVQTPGVSPPLARGQDKPLHGLRVPQRSVRLLQFLRHLVRLDGVLGEAGMALFLPRHRLVPPPVDLADQVRRLVL